MSIFDEVNTWEKTKGASIFSSILQVSDPVTWIMDVVTETILFLRHMLLVRSAKCMLSIPSLLSAKRRGHFRQPGTWQVDGV